MHYRIDGISPDAFRPFIGLPAPALAAAGITRVTATEPDAYPCRITLTDAASGDTLLLLNYEHLPQHTPYRSRHAIYINERAGPRGVFHDEVPRQLARRLLSLRAFDAGGMMVDADVTEGREAEPLIRRLLALPGVEFLHAHFARRGCYAARIARA